MLPLAEIGWEYYDGNFPLIVPDPPLTTTEVHRSQLAIMGRFYRPSRMPSVVYHTLRFPVAMLPLVNLRARWRHWYRHWRNNVVGSVGYFVMKNWRKQFEDGPFKDKLEHAHIRLKSQGPAARKDAGDKAP